MQLKRPTRQRLTAYIERFAQTLNEPLGRAPETIAKRLGTVSFAEAEEFCLDIRRRHVLAMGEKPLREIVTECLTFWTERSKVNNKETAYDGFPPTPDSNS